MLIRNTHERYGAVAKALHWGLAVLILGLVWLGWVLVDLAAQGRIDTFFLGGGAWKIPGGNRRFERRHQTNAAVRNYKRVGC